MGTEEFQHFSHSLQFFFFTLADLAALSSILPFNYKGQDSI